MNYYLLVIGFAIVGIFVTGFRIVRPTQRGLIETFGKYTKSVQPGLTYIIPFIQTLIKIDVTENIANADTQIIITKDNLNAKVNAQIYYKVKIDEVNLKASQYNVSDYEYQIVQLARTTLRNIIGSMTLTETNNDRNKINKDLMTTLKQETENWGIEVVRAELQEIDPPEDVQQAMNQIVIAENDKKSAVDFATAKETQADGEKRASIKSAEGRARAVEIEADAKAKAIKTVNEAAEKYFIGNAQIMKQLEVTQASLENNSKIILTEKGINPVVVLGDSAIITSNKKVKQ